MSTLYSDVQTLNPGDLVDLFELDGTPIGANDVLRFHGYAIGRSLFWQGLEYGPWPIMVDGMARTGQQQPTPTITVGNLDSRISALCQAFDDMVGAELRMHRTLSKFLDGSPTANPTQEILDIWIVERKADERRETVQFELANPMTFQGAQLPGEIITADVCSWITRGGYRGPYCGYTGGPVMDVRDNPTSDPAKDNCSGTLRACKARFGANNELSFGSFPAAGLIRS